MQEGAGGENRELVKKKVDRRRKKLGRMELERKGRTEQERKGRGRRRQSPSR